MRYVRRTYLTMNDTLKRTSPIDGMPKTFGMLFDSIGETLWKDIFSKMQSSYCSELFDKYIFPRLWKTPITYVDTLGEPTQEDLHETLEERYGEIFSWLVSTTDRYEYLIKTYNDELANLMDDVEVVQVNRFNDTPQDSDDVAGQDFATNITTNKTSNPQTTKIVRIEEIRQFLRNAYEDWYREFEYAFIIRDI